jgi:hypothetical protein
MYTYIEYIFWPMFVGPLEAVFALHCAYWKLYGLQRCKPKMASAEASRDSPAPFGALKCNSGIKLGVFRQNRS